MESWFAVLVPRVTVLCVAAVLAAVAWNFLRAGGAVAERQRSPVATGTMLAFFAGVYLLIHHRVGVVPLPPVAAMALASVGLLLLVAGTIVNLLGRLRLGRNWANQVTLYREQTLVQDGVFGLVRHPLYASLIWMSCGAGLAYVNAAAVLATFAVFVPAMIYRARQEEALLEAQFPEYNAYQQRVGRLWPRLPGGRRHDRSPRIMQK